MNPVYSFLDFDRIAPSDVDPRDYTVVIIADPKFGKYDKEHSGDGTKWENDEKNVHQFCTEVNQMQRTPAFIAILGDLAQALSHESRTNRLQKGSETAFRTPQTVAFFNALRECNSKIPILISAGDRDLGPDRAVEVDWRGFEKQSMNTYFNFEFGGRYWMSVDTNAFNLENDYAKWKRKYEMEWLEDTLERAPKGVPKTVFQHMPLYVDGINEPDNTKSLPGHVRQYLLDQYSKFGVDTIFSGHVHFNSVPEQFEGVNQVCLTSINYQDKKWVADSGNVYGGDSPAYIVASVKNAELSWQRVELTLPFL